MTKLYNIMIAEAEKIAAKCTACKFCIRNCSFLQDHGMPDVIAKKLLAGEIDPAVALKCNVCGLCTKVCTVRGLDPTAMFKAMRDAAIEADPALLKPFKPRLDHEILGLSKPFAFHGIPKGAKIALFAGCDMPGAMPDTVWDCFLKLREHDPRMGFVLHCCANTSKMLGMLELHEQRLGEVIDLLAAAGLEEVLVLCPSCLVTLKSANPPFKVRTVYELLAEIIPEPEPGMERVRTGVHDPCVLRDERSVHEAVRTILWNTGSSVAEMRHSMHKSLCCGEGGGVKLVQPKYAAAWSELRLAEATQRRVVTYCSGCVRQLGPELNAAHVLDLVLGKKTLPVNEWPQPPKANLARIMLKRKAKAFFDSAG